jgi:hypothetical protein
MVFIDNKRARPGPFNQFISFRYIIKGLYRRVAGFPVLSLPPTIARLMYEVSGQPESPKMKQLTVLLFLLSITGCLAQPHELASSRISSGLDLGAGFAANQFSPSASYYQLMNLTRSRAFSLGWTATFRTYYASDRNYITAPAELSRGKTGFAALGAPYQLAQIDTLRMASASNTSLNFGIRAQVRFSIFEVGASADLLGLTLGRTRPGRYLSSSGYFIGQSQSGADSLVRFRGSNVDQSAKPAQVNLQLLGDNSYGTLATEVYVRVRASQRLGVKVGYQWLMTEYRTSVVNEADGNNRFRNRAGLFYVAATFPFFM